MGALNSYFLEKKRIICKQLASTLLLFLLLGSVSSAYAIPPPEAILLVGGTILYPGLLLLGILFVLMKYVWVKTKLHLLWRLYLGKVASFLLIVLICLSIPLFTHVAVQNRPVTAQTIKSWQHSNSQPVFIDVRQRSDYNKLHLVGAISYPAGEGLTDYLNTHKDKKIILYCDWGVQSGNFHWLQVDKGLLIDTLNDNRLFYYPGGLKSMVQLRDANPFPMIINISTPYAKYLLGQTNFTEIQLPNDKNPPTAQQLVSEYNAIIAKHHIPIINSQIASDVLAEKLNTVDAKQLYFANFTKDESRDKDSTIVVIIFAAIILFYIIRRKELLRSFTAKPSSIYQCASLLISLIATVSCMQLTYFDTIPFDIYLYPLHTGLPMNAHYLIIIYMFFSISWFVHLLFPNTKRLEFLRFKVNNIFAPRKYASAIPNLQIRKQLLITMVTVAILYQTVPLSTILVISVFLLIHIVIDVFLYYGTISTLKNTPSHLLAFLKQCGFVCAPEGERYALLDTKDSLSLATFVITIEKQPIQIGLFSGEVLADSSNSKSPISMIEKSDLDFMRCCALVRNVLMLFGQDIQLYLNRNGSIVSIKLYGNYLSSKALNQHVLLKHFQMSAGDIHEKRFTSSLYEEVFENPAPLMLDVLKQRWNKGGGCLKALRKLSVFIKFSDKAMEQLVVFSNKFYLDQTFEKTLFSASKFHLFIRKILLEKTSRLALDNITQDYYSLILPKTELRLAKLSDLLEKTLSVKQLKRAVNKSITALCKESAMWQSYSSLLHQQAFNQLQSEAQKAACDLSSLLNYPLSPSHLLPLPPYYDLSSSTSSFEFDKGVGEPSVFTSYQNAFLKAEIFRTNMRQFQLKEWQLIGLLLEKLRIKLMLPISLVYLEREDLYHLPKNPNKLLALLHLRHETWCIRNQWRFPASFSLRDLELGQALQTSNANAEIYEAIRVSGNQQQIAGTAVVFEQSLEFDKLPTNSILIADNLLPEQIIACQHVRGIILRKGSYLSHTSIIAREKNIPIIAQYPIEKISNKDKLLVHARNQITIIKSNVLDWRFLDSLACDLSIGNKAQRLAILSQKGFKLPESIILKHKDVKAIYELACIPSVLNEKQSKLWQDYYDDLTQLFCLFDVSKSPLILRSSTNKEDSSDYSYAGIFYSEANISTVEALISAIGTSWQKMLASIPVIEKYSGESAKLALNLIVQQYITSQFGGVLFTQSSMPGMMQLEVSSGGAEGVAHGEGLVASLYINEHGESANTDQKQILSTKHYQTLYQLGCNIEALFGVAQDIEWLVSEEQVYIIQSRDITHMV